MITIEAITVGPFAMNSYVVGDSETKECVVVDPGDELERIESYLKQHDYTVQRILMTHGHIDHVAFAEVFHQRYQVPLGLHKADEPLAQAVGVQAAMYGIEVGPPILIDEYYEPGAQIGDGSLSFKIAHAPGHSPGSVLFIHPDGFVIGGDVLFHRSIGRTDLPGGNHDQLLASIRRELFSLPGETVVYPGHGPSTTVAEEIAENPFLT